MKSTTLYIDPLHISIMDVLNEFKVLTSHLLMDEVNYKGKLDSFRKVLRSLMNKNLISTFRDSNNRPNFVFLKGKAEEATLFHDFKAAELALALRAHPLEPRVTLAHKFDSKSLVPDVILDFKTFKVFLELELSMKSETKIRKKVEHYINTSASTQIMYVFRLERDLRRYREVIDSVVEELNETKRLEMSDRKFILVLDKEIHTPFDPKRATVFFKDKSESLAETLRLPTL